MHLSYARLVTYYIPPSFFGSSIEFPTTTKRTKKPKKFQSTNCLSCVAGKNVHPVNWLYLPCNYVPLPCFLYKIYLPLNRCLIYIYSIMLYITIKSILCFVLYKRLIIKNVDSKSFFNLSNLSIFKEF